MLRALPWFGILLLLAALAFSWLGLPIVEWLREFDRWVETRGAWGVVMFGAVYALAIVALAPARLLAIGAGVLFGAWAFPLVIVSATTGAIGAFLVARHLMRERMKRMVAGSPRLSAIDQAVDQGSWAIVVLTRLIPYFPLGIQNYVFGATAVGLPAYAVGTFFGIMPSTAINVYFGAIGRTLATEQMGRLHWLLPVVGIVASAVLIFLIMWVVRSKLNAVDHDGSAHPSQ